MTELSLARWVYLKTDPILLEDLASLIVNIGKRIIQVYHLLQHHLFPFLKILYHINWYQLHQAGLK